MMGIQHGVGQWKIVLIRFFSVKALRLASVWIPSVVEVRRLDHLTLCCIFLVVTWALVLDHIAVGHVHYLLVLSLHLRCNVMVSNVGKGLAFGHACDMRQFIIILIFVSNNNSINEIVRFQWAHFVADCCIFFLEDLSVAWLLTC